MNFKKLTLSLLVASAFLISEDIMAQRIEVRIGGGHRYAALSRPPCPGPDYVWVEGRWVWDDYYRREIWIDGYWMLREREYYCDHHCHHNHKHHYEKRRHDRGRGYAYGRR